MFAGCPFVRAYVRACCRLLVYLFTWTIRWQVLRRTTSSCRQKLSGQSTTTCRWNDLQPLPRRRQRPRQLLQARPTSHRTTTSSTHRPATGVRRSATAIRREELPSSPRGRRDGDHLALDRPRRPRRRRRGAAGRRGEAATRRPGTATDADRPTAQPPPAAATPPPPRSWRSWLSWQLITVWAAKRETDTCIRVIGRGRGPVLKIFSLWTCENQSCFN